MAKCPICNSRKGQRLCLIAASPVCSLCCGTTRTADSCLGCRFYQKPRRSYNDVPAYSVSEMDGDMDLADYGNVIEGALCSYDEKNGGILKDSDAIRITEALIDSRYFGDQPVNEDSMLITNGVAYVENAIREDLSGIDNKIIVKILGVIRFVARRRTKTGREYMNIIHQYVGQRMGSGIRLIRTESL